MVGSKRSCLLLKNKQGEATRAMARDYWTIQLNSKVQFVGGEVQVEIGGYDPIARGNGQEGIHYGRLV